MSRKNTLIVISIVFIFCLIAGCDSLRFAPTTAQKQAAHQTLQTAMVIEQAGTDAHSEAAQQQVAGSSAALSYIGMPADPKVEDYQTTVVQAQADAARRPTMVNVLEQAEGGLSLAAELAILFGVGGSAVGGKKILDWITLAKDKNKALQEVIVGNENFLNDLKRSGNSAVVDIFKAHQNSKQTEKSQKLVAAARVPIKTTPATVI